MKKYSIEDIEYLKQLYLKGHSSYEIKTLAKEQGISVTRGYVTKLLKTYGVTLRSQSESTKLHHPRRLKTKAPKGRKKTKLEQAVENEREACARVADECLANYRYVLPRYKRNDDTRLIVEGAIQGAESVASLIRARGDCDKAKP